MPPHDCPKYDRRSSPTAARSTSMSRAVLAAPRLARNSGSRVQAAARPLAAVGQQRRHVERLGCHERRRGQLVAVQRWRAGADPARVEADPVEPREQLERGRRRGAHELHGRRAMPAGVQEQASDPMRLVDGRAADQRQAHRGAAGPRVVARDLGGGALEAVVAVAPVEFRYRDALGRGRLVGGRRRGSRGQRGDREGEGRNRMARWSRRPARTGRGIPGPVPLPR
jgi:hypothetical protein